MKKILLFSCFSLINMFVFAQKIEEIAQNPAKEATAKLKETYHLTDSQTAQMETIQAQKQRNLSEIEKYKSTDEVLYVSKRQAISTGTSASIERMLDKEQTRILREKQGALRLARAKKSEEFRSSKASELQKQMILLELEEQF